MPWNKRVDLLLTTLMAVVAALALWQLIRFTGVKPQIDDLPVGPLAIDGLLQVGKSNEGGVILLFSDFQCPFCVEFAGGEMGQLRKGMIDGGLGLLKFAHFPLERIHPASAVAAAAVECARAEDLGWQMHDGLFERSARAALVKATDVGAVVASVAAPEAAHRIETCIASGRQMKLLAGHKELGKVLGVTGTPTFVIGVMEGGGFFRSAEFEEVPALHPFWRNLRRRPSRVRDGQMAARPTGKVSKRRGMMRLLLRNPARPVFWASVLVLGMIASVQSQLTAGAAFQSGAISGVVSDAEARLPVSGAVVQLFVVGASGLAQQHGPRQVTDASGRFVFVGLSAGLYHVLVKAPGYFDGGFGSTAGSSVTGRITLQDKQWVQDAHVPIWKPAAISGTVRDDKGESLVDVPVRILSAFQVGGRRHWAAGATTLTDDRGEYRFSGLQPGKYVVLVPSIQVTLPDGEVSLYKRATNAVALPTMRGIDGLGTMVGHFAVAPPSAGVAYRTTFYPAASALPAADQIGIEFGEHRSGTDVTLHPVSTARLSGSVSGPPSAISNLPVRLLATGNESLGFGAETALTNTDATGRFALNNVPTGDYTLIVGRSVAEFRSRNLGTQPAVTPTGANPFLQSYSGSSVGGANDVLLSTNGMAGQDATGRLSVSVGADGVEGVVVPAKAGVVVAGRVRLDGSDTPPADGIVQVLGPRIGLEPLDELVLHGFRHSVPRPRPSDLTFSIPDVPPGRYQVVNGGIEGYAIVRATWNGRDLFEQPIEVTGDDPIDGIVIDLSSKKTGVSGTVRSTDGPSSAVVYVFPRERGRWNAVGIRASLFRVLEVPATGVFATDDMVPGDYLVAALSAEHLRHGIDQEVLGFLADRATRVSVVEGTVSPLDLRVIEWRR